MGKEKTIPHWHCNKRWTDINKTREALAILESSQFEKKTWNVARQSFYAILLNKKGLSGSTNPRSARAIFGTFKFFGFAWTKNKKLVINPAGKAFIHNDMSKILKLQLLKWQFPNPYEGKGIVAPYTKSLTLFPFRVILRLLYEMGRLYEDELALFVWKVKSDSDEELKRVKREIRKYRKLSEGRREELCARDPLFVTDHEYEAHLRPYITATGLCSFDRNQRFLKINPKAKKEIERVLSEAVMVKTDWKDEEEWFTYYGNTKYRYPPRMLRFELKSRVGMAIGFCVKIVQNGREAYGITSNKGNTNLSLFDYRTFIIEVIRPSDGKIVFKGSKEVKPRDSSVVIRIKEGLPPRIESVDELIGKVNQLLSAGLDDDIRNRLEMRKRITKQDVSRKFLGHLRGSRFEQLICELLLLYEKKVFDSVVWRGHIGEWGLPIAAGAGAPDILAFEPNCVYVIEATLLRGRAQWEKPEAVSVPEHIENMIKVHRKKRVCGLFIAQKLDPSVEANLVNRAINKGYEVVPMEINEFVDLMRLLNKTPSREVWGLHYTHLWKVQKRTVHRKERS